MSYWIETKEKLDAIYNRMQDDESRRWFDARVEYMLTSGDKSKYLSALNDIFAMYPKSWRCELEHVLKKRQKIIIYGCDAEGKRVKEGVERCGYTVSAYCSDSYSESDAVFDGKKSTYTNRIGNRPQRGSSDFARPNEAGNAL